MWDQSGSMSPWNQPPISMGRYKLNFVPLSVPRESMPKNNISQELMNALEEALVQAVIKPKKHKAIKCKVEIIEDR